MSKCFSLHMVERMRNVSMVWWRRVWEHQWVLVEMCRMVSWRVMVTLSITCIKIIRIISSFKAWRLGLTYLDPTGGGRTCVCGRAGKEHHGGDGGDLSSRNSSHSCSGGWRLLVRDPPLPPPARPSRTPPASLSSSSLPTWHLDKRRLYLSNLTIIMQWRHMPWYDKRPLYQLQITTTNGCFELFLKIKVILYWSITCSYYWIISVNLIYLNDRTISRFQNQGWEVLVFTKWWHITLNAHFKIIFMDLF